MTATALDASRVTLAWASSTDDVGVVGYRLYRDSVLVATTTATSYVDTGLAPSTNYAYEVVAFDAAGNASTAASSNATTQALDGIPPTVPTNLTARLSKGKKVALAWGASSDNVGVMGYQLYRNGKLVATVTGTSYTDALGTKMRTATYEVVAFDAADNVSAASNPVTVSF